MTTLLTGPPCVECGNRTYLDGPEKDRQVKRAGNYFHRQCFEDTRHKQTPLMDRCSHCGAVLNGNKECPNQSRKGHLPPERVQ